MNKDGFQSFLKKQRRSEGTIFQCLRLSEAFEAYLIEYRHGVEIDMAQPEDLNAFVSWMNDQRKSVNSHLWAIHRYYDFTSNTEMRQLANKLRQDEITRKRGGQKSLKLEDIHSISAEQTEKLAGIGISDVKGLLEKGRTQDDREDLAKRSSIPNEEILKLVKLADLTRLVDIKGQRVRLLYEADIDTLEKISTYDPVKLHEILMAVNSEKQILRRQPTIVETSYWVSQARELEKIIEF